MQANSPSAFFLSLTLHGLVVALIVFFSIVAREHVKEHPKVFELVAGEGDNYAATEAPALGNPDVVKFNVPTTPAPVIRTAPPEPVVRPAPEPPKVVETKTPNFSKDVKRIADKREKRLLEADRKKRAAEEKKAREAEERRKKEEDALKKKMTKEEFDRLHGNQRNPAGKAPAAPKVKQIDTAGIRKGVLGGSTNNTTGGAGGKALAREQQNLLDSYIALLLQRLRAAHEKPPGLSDLLHAKVQFRVGADGTLSGVKIIESSGSAAFDRSVLEAFARVRSIGPTPDGKSDVWEVTFRMKEED